MKFPAYIPIHKILCSYSLVTFDGNDGKKYTLEIKKDKIIEHSRNIVHYVMSLTHTLYILDNGNVCFQKRTLEVVYSSTSELFRFLSTLNIDKEK